jgi:hypothetical protein
MEGRTDRGERMSDYSPDPIPGLESDHPARVRPGFRDPEHDRAVRTPDGIDRLDIATAVYRLRYLQRMTPNGWQAEPLARRLHDMLAASHVLLRPDDSPLSTALRSQIESVIPALRGPTDTQRLDWAVERYKITREWIDSEMSREQALQAKSG